MQFFQAWVFLALVSGGLWVLGDVSAEPHNFLGQNVLSCDCTTSAYIHVTTSSTQKEAALQMHCCHVPNGPLLFQQLVVMVTEVSHHQCLAAPAVTF